MAGCPSGWKKVGDCNNNFTCEDGCGDWGIQYKHKYVRCKNNKTGATDCYWLESEYMGCCE